MPELLHKDFREFLEHLISHKVISALLSDLLTAKKTAGRPKDLADLLHDYLLPEN